MEDSPTSLLRQLCEILPLDYGSIANVLKTLHVYPWDDGMPAALMHAVGKIGEAASASGEVHECGAGPDELLDICIAALAKVVLIFTFYFV